MPGKRGRPKGRKSKKEITKKLVRKSSGKPAVGVEEAQVEKPKIKSVLSAKELRMFKELLLKKKSDLLRNVDRLSDSVVEKGEETEVSQHPADSAIGTDDNYVTLNLAEDQAELLKLIDIGLDKIEEKTYGICENCEKPITKQRLKVVPYTKLCIQCQSAEESGR